MKHSRFLRSLSPCPFHVASWMPFGRGSLGAEVPCGRNGFTSACANWRRQGSTRILGRMAVDCGQCHKSYPFLIQFDSFGGIELFMIRCKALCKIKEILKLSCGTRGICKIPIGKYPIIRVPDIATSTDKQRGRPSRWPCNFEASGISHPPNYVKCSHDVLPHFFTKTSLSLPPDIDDEVSKTRSHWFFTSFLPVQLPRKDGLRNSITTTSADRCWAKSHATGKATLDGEMLCKTRPAAEMPPRSRGDSRAQFFNTSSGSCCFFNGINSHHGILS